MQADQPIDEGARDRRLGLALGELELRVLEIEDALAERLALLHIVDRLVERALDRRHALHGDVEPLLRQLLHQLDKALALLARRAGWTVGTRTSSKNSSDVSCASSPTLSRLRPRAKPSASSVSTTISEVPLAPALGSVLATTMIRLAVWPLVMKVFWP